MDLIDALVMEDIAEEMLAKPTLEKSTFLNVHNATALVDNITRKEFYITFDGRTKKTVKFAKSFVAAAEDFFKRECGQGGPYPVNRWRLLPGHLKFKNQAWYNKNKDRECYVWTYWTAAGFIGNLLINPVLMQALDPMDYRVKAEERSTEGSKSSMHKSSLYNVVHKVNALLTM